MLVAMYPDPKPDARNPKNVWPPDGLPKDLIPDWPYLFKMPTDHDAKLKGSKAKETGASDNHSDQEAFYMVQSLGPFVKTNGTTSMTARSIVSLWKSAEPSSFRRAAARSTPKSASKTAICKP